MFFHSEIFSMNCSFLSFKIHSAQQQGRTADTNFIITLGRCRRKVIEQEGCHSHLPERMVTYIYSQPCTATDNKQEWPSADCHTSCWTLQLFSLDYQLKLAEIYTNLTFLYIYINIFPFCFVSFYTKQSQNKSGRSGLSEFTRGRGEQNFALKV